MWQWRFKASGSQYVRVVKEVDSKSTGVTRAGSNPAADVFFYFYQLFKSYLFIYIPKEILFIYLHNIIIFILTKSIFLSKLLFLVVAILNQKSLEKK